MIFQPKILFGAAICVHCIYLSMSSHRDRWVCFRRVFPCVFFFLAECLYMWCTALTRCKWVNIDLIDTTKGSGAYACGTKIPLAQFARILPAALCVHWPWWRCFLCCGTYEDIFLDKLPTDLCGLLMIVVCRRALWRIEILLLSVLSPLTWDLNAYALLTHHHLLPTNRQARTFRLSIAKKRSYVTNTNRVPLGRNAFFYQKIFVIACE